MHTDCVFCFGMGPTEDFNHIIFTATGKNISLTAMQREL